MGRVLIGNQTSPEPQGGQPIFGKRMELKKVGAKANQSTIYERRNLTLVKYARVWSRLRVTRQRIR